MPYRPAAPHFVYRLDFADGWSYVGTTSRSVETQIQDPLGLLYMDGWCGHHDRAVRLRRGWGTQGIMARHVAMGYSWTWAVLAQGLSLDRQAAAPADDRTGRATPAGQDVARRPPTVRRYREPATVRPVPFEGTRIDCLEES